MLVHSFSAGRLICSFHDLLDFDKRAAKVPNYSYFTKSFLKKLYFSDQKSHTMPDKYGLVW
jgi:hypothetical protein